MRLNHATAAGVEKILVIHGGSGKKAVYLIQHCLSDHDDFSNITNLRAAFIGSGASLKTVNFRLFDNAKGNRTRMGRGLLCALSKGA